MRYYIEVERKQTAVRQEQKEQNYDKENHGLLFHFRTKRSSKLLELPVHGKLSSKCYQGKRGMYQTIEDS